MGGLVSGLVSGLLNTSSGSLGRLIRAMQWLDDTGCHMSRYTLLAVNMARTRPRQRLQPHEGGMVGLLCLKYGSLQMIMA